MRIVALLSFIVALSLSCESRKSVSEVISIKYDELVSRTYGLRAKAERISAKPKTLHNFGKYNNLSNQFNLKVTITEPNDIFITSHLALYIFSKDDSLCQKIAVDVLALGPIGADNVVRSYETKLNLNKPVPDEFFGKIVVGDFNFDSLSDIAVISCIPMSGTPMYEFYFQNKNFKFVKDKYFSNVVKNLPEKLDPVNKTFMAYYHTGCCAQTYRYFRFDRNGKCKLTYTKEIDMNRD